MWFVSGKSRGARHRYPALALCTVGIEAFLVARLRRVLCPTNARGVRRFSHPARGRIRRHIRPLAARNRGVCHHPQRRRGDFGAAFCLSPIALSFRVFPVRNGLPDAPADGDYLYAASNAHRDWNTLLEALKLALQRAILSPGAPLEVPPALAHLVEVRPGLTPGAGRELMARARLVVMPFFETPLSCGPLVLLDAMSMARRSSSAMSTARAITCVMAKPLWSCRPAMPPPWRALEQLNHDPSLRQTLRQSRRPRAFWERRMDRRHRETVRGLKQETEEWERLRKLMPSPSHCLLFPEEPSPEELSPACEEIEAVTGAW